MSALGNLVVSLALDHAKFSDGLNKSDYAAKKAAANIERSFSTLKNGLASLGGLIGVGGLTAFVKSSIDAADNLNDLSQQIGINVEQLAGYKLAAESSGTSLEGLGAGAKKLSLAIAENNPLLGKLGITARDADGALIQLADVFAALPDGAQKTALAMDLMGKSGAELIPLLNGGSVALRQMIEDGKRLYPVNSELARQADAFNDELAKMKVHTEGVGMALSGPFLKAMNDAIRVGQVAAREYGTLAGTLVGIGRAVAAPFVSTDEEKAIALQEKRYRLLDQIKKIEDSDQAASTKQATVAALRIEVQKLEAELDAVWKRGRIDLASREELRSAAAKTIRDVEITKALRDMGKPGKDKKTLAGKERMSDTEWASEESAHSVRTYYQIQQQASEEYAAQLRAEFDAEWALTEIQDDQYRAGRDAAARWTEALDPMQKYRDDLEEIARLEREGYLTADKAMAAQFLVHEQMDKALAANNEALKEQNDIARELGLTFTSAFEDAMVSGKKFGQVMAGVAQDIYRLFLRKTVSEPAMGWFSSTLAGSGLGNLFGNWFSSGGGASNLSAFSSMDFGSISAFSTAFARGGIMTDRGPLPLHTYAGGGIADRPQLAVFGEGRRPEAYVPLPDGRRIPVTMQGGGGVTIVQNFDFRNATAEAEAKLRAEAGRIKRETLATLMDNLNRGGAFASATGRI